MSEDEKKVPKLRFPGFEGEWEERKLSELGASYAGLFGKTKKDFGHGKARFVTYMNVFSNSIADPNGVEYIEIDLKQNQVEYGDVFFTVSSETPEEVGMSSVWLNNSENIYLNSFCFGYRPERKLDSYYLAYMLRSPEVRKKFVILAQGISRYNISKKRVMDIDVYIAGTEEQQKIGSFLKTIEELIAIQQKKIEKLEKIKAGLLKKMFPQNKQKSPIIRFPEFLDKWERCELRNKLLDIGTGKSKFNSKLKDENCAQYAILGSTSVIGYDSSYDYSGEFILTARVGVNAGELYRYSGDVKISDNTVYMRGRNLDFMYYLLKSYNLKKLSFGTGQPLIKASELNKLSLMFPTEEKESQKIGDFFVCVDNLIELNVKKLHDLQQLKKGLLQQMFV